jgi:3-oxoacyl-(acyl-carrier-protein) synthase
VIGFVPDDAVTSLQQADPVHADSAAFLFADAAVREAIDASDGLIRATCSSRRALVLSTTKGQVDALERQVAGGAVSDMARRHILPHALAVDLALRQEVRGPVRCISAACISGLLAIQQGVALIQRDEADIALVVGVDIVSHFVLAGFDTLKSLDPEGCRPFDRDRVGLTLGEGAGAIVLARADLPAGCRERIIGWGSSNDANHLTGPSRDGSGLALAIDRALKKASVLPRAIDYINAHGTGTPYNDNMESLALRSIFGEATPPFSGSKGLFGHTLGAAGVLETVLCLVALRHGLMPGTPRLCTADPVAPASLLREPVGNSRLQRILKLNSGFGGANAALVIEREVG